MHGAGRGVGCRVSAAIGRLLLVLVIAGSAIACGQKPAPAPPPVIHHLGEAIPIGDLVVTANSLSFPAPTPFAVPEPGKKFVGVDVTVQNKSNEQLNVFSRDVMFLKDGQGHRYVEDTVATSVAGTGPPDGDPLSGQAVRGVAGYQVPKDATGFTLTFDTTLMNRTFLHTGESGKQAVIALQ